MDSEDSNDNPWVRIDPTFDTPSSSELSSIASEDLNENIKIDTKISDSNGNGNGNIDTNSPNANGNIDPQILIGNHNIDDELLNANFFRIDVDMGNPQSHLNGDGAALRAQENAGSGHANRIQNMVHNPTSDDDSDDEDILNAHMAQLNGESDSEDDTMDDDDGNPGDDESEDNDAAGKTDRNGTRTIQTRSRRSNAGLAQQLKNSTRISIPLPRTRGQAAKNRAGGGKAVEAAEPVAPTARNRGTQAKRKRDTPDDDWGMRRSSRSAAKVASQRITEQERGPKAMASAFSAPSQAQTARGSNVKGKQTPEKPSEKPATKKAAKTANKTVDNAVEDTASIVVVETPKKQRARPEYEVEVILKSRGNEEAGTLQYLVKWKGYRFDKCTWEPSENLTHCEEALEQYRLEK